MFSSIRLSFNTQPPEGGWAFAQLQKPLIWVSTHSRPKAAGQQINKNFPKKRSFNTQPPEGGWIVYGRCVVFGTCFNTQPPEGGWTGDVGHTPFVNVSTHSRPKAAG